MSRRLISFLALRSMAPHEAQAPVGRPCTGCWVSGLLWTPVLLLFVTLPPLSSWPNALSSGLLRSHCYQGPLLEWYILLAFSLWRDKGSVPASGVSGLSEQLGPSLLDRDLPAGPKSRPGSAAHLSSGKAMTHSFLRAAHALRAAGWGTTIGCPTNDCQWRGLP